jgi:hypothetical protein
VPTVVPAPEVPSPATTVLPARDAEPTSGRRKRDRAAFEAY